MNKTLNNSVFMVLAAITVAGSCFNASLSDNENLNTDGEKNRLRTDLSQEAEANEKCMSKISTKRRGPVEANFGDFPWLAILYIRDRDGDNGMLPLCGGTLISANQVITHKNCITNDTARYFVTLGEHDFSKVEDCVDNVCAPPVQEIEVAEITPKPDLMSNGIILTLAQPAKLNDFVKPLCWKLEERAVPNRDLVVAGWGISPKHQANFRVKTVARIQFKNSSECEGFDIQDEPEDMGKCLEQGYEKQLEVLDYGGAVLMETISKNNNRHRAYFNIDVETAIDIVFKLF